MVIVFTNTERAALFIRGTDEPPSLRETQAKQREAAGTSNRLPFVIFYIECALLSYLRAINHCRIHRLLECVCDATIRLLSKLFRWIVPKACGELCSKRRMAKVSRIRIEQL